MIRSWSGAESGRSLCYNRFLLVRTLLLLLFACAGAPVDPPEAPSRVSPPSLPPEVDVPFSGQGQWVIGEQNLVLKGRLLYRGDTVLVDRVYDPPVAGPDVLYVPADTPDGEGVIYAVRPDGRVDAVVRGGRPDQLVISPDGALAFVSGVTEISSVYVLKDGQIRQLTNVGLVRVPGRAPEGWVPPPRRNLKFEGEFLRWEADGERRVSWR